MIEIIKTWPSQMGTKHTMEVFTHAWGYYYFSLGRGKPKQQPERVFFTHRSRILGSFDILELVKNAGQLPELKSLSGETSPWQFKRDVWVAVCVKFSPLKENIFHEGFRGWRYFSLAEYSKTLESKVQI